MAKISTRRSPPHGHEHWERDQIHDDDGQDDKDQDRDAGGEAVDVLLVEVEVGAKARHQVRVSRDLRPVEGVAGASFEHAGLRCGEGFLFRAWRFDALLL